MEHAFPLVLLAIAGIFVAVVLIHNLVIRPIRRHMMNRAVDKRLKEIRIELLLDKRI